MTHPRTPPPNVLIFYGGRGLTLAQSLLESLRIIGCDANILKNLPHVAGGVHDKFEYYFHRAKYFIVIVTGEAGQGGDRTPRDAILPEMERCLHDRPSDTMVVKESGVTLPSTLPPVVWEDFKRHSFHDVLPTILKQLSERGLLRRAAKRRLLKGSALGAGQRTTEPWVEKFVGDMDYLWSAIDTAWEMAGDHDRILATHVLTQLDSFIVDYYYALLGIIRRRSGPQLQKYLLDCYKRCQQYVTELLRDVLDDFRDEAHKLAKSVPQEARDRFRYQMGDADEQASEFESRQTIAGKVTAFRNAVNYYKQLVKQR